MSKLNAGGSATNSGIDYQQRVAACLQVFLYTEFELSHVLSRDFNCKIESIHFETNEPIDDLKIICESNGVLYLQIKRSISFSIIEGSDFYNTICQFINQYAAENNTKHSYLLVSSGDCSSKISYELNKIVESIRLNDTGFELNPLNASEREVHSKFQDLFKSIYETRTGKKASENKFIEFAKRVYISILDVENEKPLEKSAIILLAGTMVQPELIWSLLIKNSLHYAASRTSINRHALKEILDRYRKKREQKDEEQDLSELYKAEITLNGEYPCGKEHVIIESLDFEKADFMILEMFRFSEDCAKRFTFSSGKITLPKLGRSPKVFLRCATAAAVVRFVDENTELFEGKKIVILPAPELEQDIEESNCVKLYKKYLNELFNTNSSPGRCLHCDKPITSENNLLVEIDDNDLVNALGAIHKHCHRPVDRILGTAKSLMSDRSKYLANFDNKKWVELVIKGQGLMHTLKDSKFGDCVISWSSDTIYDADLDYCVKFFLEDGSIHFGFERGKIRRLTQLDTEEWVKKMNEQIKLKKKENSPLCISSKNKYFGEYSMLLSRIDNDEKLIEISRAEVARYSAVEAKFYENDIMYYAPLCIIRCAGTDVIFNIGKMIPIISDPFEIGAIVESWKKAGIEIDNIELKIIESDRDFDGYMGSFFADHMQPILDPVLDMQGQLAKGIYFNHFEKMIAEKEQQQSSEKNDQLSAKKNPFWKEGDLVRIALPGDTHPEPMVGKLIADEQINQKNIEYVLFRPIENGTELPDVNLAIPSKFVSKWDGSKS